MNDAQEIVRKKIVRKIKWILVILPSRKKKIGKKKNILQANQIENINNMSYATNSIKQVLEDGHPSKH